MPGKRGGPTRTEQKAAHAAKVERQRADRRSRWTPGPWLREYAKPDEPPDPWVAEHEEALKATAFKPKKRADS